MTYPHANIHIPIPPSSRSSSVLSLVRGIALACGVMLLSACASGLLPKAPAAATQLTLDLGDNLASSSAVSTAPSLPQGSGDWVSTKTLVVEAMRTDAGYDTRDIAYRLQPVQVEYFAHHQWVDTPARMLAPLMVRALESKGAFRAIVVAPSTAVGQLRLETTLVRLEQDFSQVPSRARLTLRAVVIETASRQALATKTWDVQVAATHDDPSHGALAASQAAQSVLDQLADFCVDTAGLVWTSISLTKG